MSDYPPLKLGVLGVSAHFVTRVLLPLKQSATIDVYGIASRGEEKAKEAAERWGIAHHYDSYEALLQDKAIEAVYIPLPNHLHLEWIKKALNAGKHVICEKPLTLDSEQARELIEYTQGSTFKVMEAFMYRFHPKWQHVKELVAFGAIGKVRAIQSVFAYNNADPNNIRNIKACGGGALMDIGCYAIHSARFILGTEPRRVLADMTLHPEFGTDCYTSAMLDFGDATCQFTVATGLYPQQEVTVFGQSGAIKVILPFNEHDDVKGKMVVTTGLGSRTVEFEPVNQYRLQFEQFAEAIREETAVPVSLTDSLANMKVIDGLFESHRCGGWVDLD